MGLKRLVAHTLTTNIEMRGPYPEIGFVELDMPLKTTTYTDQPMLRSHLHVFAKHR